MDIGPKGWQTLRQLRQGFLVDKAGIDDYWKSEVTVRLYHQTLGQRILWKWQAVWDKLDEERPNILENKSVRVLDWGCGSGIASTSLLENAKRRKAILALDLFDRSRIATAFAKKHLQEQFQVAANITTEPANQYDLILFSHVLNELDDIGFKKVVATAKQSKLFVWVEPGTKLAATRLAALRNELAIEYEALAPCTHQEKCPLTETHGHDWCHFFAKPPSAVSQSAFWRQYHDEMGIDSQRLPLSFLVMRRKASDSLAMSEEKTRIVGNMRFNKAGVQILGCSSSGVNSQLIAKRSAKDTLKSLKKKPFAPCI